MTDYTIIAQRFNSEFRNGSSFSVNPTTDYSVDLKGNVGELVKLTQTIQISVTVNPSEIQTIQYNATADATYGEFVGTGINFLNEGIYTGATVHITWGGGAAVAGTVELISGTGYNKFRVTKSALITAGIVDGDIRTDFKIRLASVPDTLIYKYGLNPNGSTYTNYASPLDGNAQAYYTANLTGTLQTLTRVGLGVASWDVGTVQAKYDTTVSTYLFQYTIEHIFRIPYYKDGDLTYIDGGTAPTEYLGTASLTYDNGYFFGGTILGEYIKAETKGGLGSVGYYGENYNGFLNNYGILNVAISNADNSGVLEGTVTNTVTFQVKKYDGSWSVGNSKIIFYHSKLPTSTEYSNKTTVYDTIWIYEWLEQIEGAAPVVGTIISNFTVTINADTTLLDVSLDIDYSSAQQALILNTAEYLLYVTVGDLPAIADDRVTLIVDQNQFSKNLDVSGLITSATVEFFEPFEAFSGVRGINNLTGWDGDILGTKVSVIKDSTISSYIKYATFRILSTDGTNEFELLAVPVPLGRTFMQTVGGEFYQVFNETTNGYLNVPTGTAFNQSTALGQVPVAQTGVQTLTFQCGFQTTWRSWIENLNVPTSFYDLGEDQNNRNYKTSNYSGVDSYDIYPAWDFTVVSAGGVETIYRKWVSKCNIYDFDTNGATFTAANYYYDIDGNVVDDIFVNQNVRIEIVFTHALGVISKGDIEGYIWIERNNSIIDPFYLHTSINLTSVDNPLSPSDTLSTGNYQFVEVVSANNLIKLICYTNKDNLQDGVGYNIYGRIKNKTLL